MDSVTLYQRCKKDDSRSEAYGELFQYLYRISYGIVYRQPDADALAQDCAQESLVKIHQELHGLLEPKAFLSWSRRIVHNRTIDELRKRKRLQPLRSEENHPDNPNLPAAFLLEMEKQPVLEQMTEAALRELMAGAPVSDRSRRVVNGRYLDNLPDTQLAETETRLADTLVEPKHIQVTRSKNIQKLKQWPDLRAFLLEGV